MTPTYSIVGADGKTYGPITLYDLKMWIKEGRISGETIISRSDQGTWLPAAHYTELGFPTTPASPPSLAGVTQSAEQVEFDKRIKSGASWFYWIAGLSLINSISAWSGSEWGFILGLGITQFIDGFSKAIAGSVGLVVAIVLDLLVLGGFVALGIFAAKRHAWAFIVGMVIYAADGLLFVLTGEWLSVGFHVFALFCIFAGFNANREMKALVSSQPR